MSKQRNYFAVAGSRWEIWQNDDDSYPIGQAHLAVLMDIRGELQRLNTLLHCSNFTGIPSELRAIKRNTAKRKKPKL